MNGRHAALLAPLALASIAGGVARAQEPDWDEPWSSGRASGGDLVSDVPEVNNPRLHATVGAAFGARRGGEDAVGADQTNAAPQLKLAYVHPVMTVVAIGGALHRTAHESDLDEALSLGDSHVHGLSLLGELRYPMRSGIVPYLRLATGPTLSLLATETRFESFREDADPGVGWHGELSAGFQAVTARHFGVSLGLSIDLDWLAHDVELHPRDGSGITSYEVSYTLLTLGIHAGVVVPL